MFDQDQYSLTLVSSSLTFFFFFLQLSDGEGV